MALDRMSVEEIQQLLAEALKLQEEDIKQFGYVTNDTAKKLKDAEAGIRNYTATLKQSWQSLKSSAWETVKSAGESAKGASQYSNILKSGADHIARKMSGKGRLGEVGSDLIKLAASHVAATAKQADDLYKSYQQVSRAGVVGKQGITELYGTMQKFGYGIGELTNLEGILQANSKSLASLSGTAAQGTQTFSNLSKVIREGDLGVKLQYMGNSVDTINSGIAGYLRIETLTGEGQKKTQEQLQAGAEEYLVAQEKLTKITGMAADEQQSARESALNEQRFGAYIQDLKYKAVDAEARGDLATAEKFRKRAEDEQRLNIYLKNKFGDETAQGYRNIATGFRNDKTAVKFQNTYGTATTAIDSMSDVGVIADSIRNDARRNTDRGKELYKAGLAEKTFIKFSEQQRGRTLQDYSKTLEAADGQMDVQDNATKSMADMAIDQRKTRDSLQDLRQVGVRPLTGGFEMLAKAMEKVPGVASTVATKVTGGAGGTPGSAPSASTPRGNQARVQAQQGGGGTTGTATGNPSAKSKPKGSEGGGWLRDLLGLPPTVGTAKTPGSLSAIRDLVASVESAGAGGYNALWGGKQADLVNMTIAEVMNLQEQMRSSGSTAAGRYQILKGTLSEAINALQINPAITKFDQAVQDRLADYLLRRRGYDDYQSGKLTKEQFLRNLSKEFAGLPATPAGGTYYNNGLNRANVDWNTALASLATGGISSGPASGYQATLHGTEAVVPLADNKGIPVNTEVFDGIASDRVSMYSEQLQKFDSLMLAMQKHVDISNKILQRAS
jgi:muramidase (phage lysozyme)